MNIQEEYNKGRRDFTGASLRGASLRGASLPSPGIMLLCNWGYLSAELCALGMKHDADNHPSPSSFDKWSKGGPCPYKDVNISRIFNFREASRLWDPSVRSCSSFEIMKMVIIEKCADSDYHSDKD